MLYFLSMGPFKMPNAKKPNLKRLVGGQSCAAYAIKAKAYEKVLRHLEKIKEPDVIVLPVDGEIAQLHPNMKAYVINPTFAYQDTGSTITSDGKILDNHEYLQVEQNNLNNTWN
jgi:hypothetical protein